MRKVLVTGGSGFIGCNLVEYLLKNNYEVKNLDVMTPRNVNLTDYWVDCDILDLQKLKLIIKEYSPDYLVHLAARTDLRGASLKDYLVNTEGTENVIVCLKEIKNLTKVLFASSRLVCKIGHSPHSEDEYSATTAYGKSKIVGEKIVREKCRNAEYDWIIFRPTSIWGPWFEEPYRDFFDALSRGAYIHPWRQKISKSFGYVGNSVFLLERMLFADNSLGKRTIYLTDYENLDVLDWANTIRSKQGLSRVKQVPFMLLMLVAKIGTVLEKFGLRRMPLTVFRLNNLVTNMHFDTTPLREFSKELPFTSDQGVERTLNWYRDQKES